MYAVDDEVDKDGTGKKKSRGRTYQMLPSLLDLELLRAYRTKAEMYQMKKLISTVQARKDAAAKKKGKDWQQQQQEEEYTYVAPSARIAGQGVGGKQNYFQQGGGKGKGKGKGGKGKGGKKGAYGGKNQYNAASRNWQGGGGGNNYYNNNYNANYNEGGWY